MTPGAAEPVVRGSGDGAAARSAVWQTAGRIAALLAVDGHALGGVTLVARPGPALERWLAGAARLAGEDALRRMPPTIAIDQLLGGMDLAATLAAGRPVAATGFLARADGGIVVVPGAERLDRGTAACLAAALDRAGFALARDGLESWQSARIGVVAIAECCEGEGELPPALADRLAFRVGLDSLRLSDLAEWPVTAMDVAAARARLAAVSIGDDIIAALATATVKLGVASPRAALLAVRAARVLAALAGRSAVHADDAREAAGLVLTHRVTALPQQEPDDEPEPPPPPPPPDRQDDSDTESDQPLDEQQLGDLLIAAVAASLPQDVLARLAAETAHAQAAATSTAGRSGPRVKGAMRGRQVGTRRGRLAHGTRLDVLATLRAAAPWQRLRRHDAETRPVVIHRDDIRIRRFEEHRATLTIFVVDASGSAALHRLGEAKGAVELMLARCYVRRDHVALVTFRDRAAELALPPTRALARARRALAGLPGGGGTPLAHALDVARDVAVDARRRGQEPVLVLLTDCRVNIARDGSPGRPLAEQDALASARAVLGLGIDALLIDTAPRPHTFAPELSAALAARYLHLPNAHSEAVAAGAALMTAAGGRGPSTPARTRQPTRG